MKNYIDSLPYMDETKEVLHHLVDFTLERVSNVKCIGLFGSYARLEQNSRSDLDIAIVTETEVSRETRGMLYCEFEEYFADLVIVTVDTFLSSSSALMGEIRKDGILLWGH